MEKVKVLGIDPGTLRLGWSVCEGNSSHVDRLASGCISLGASSVPIAERLNEIQVQLRPILSNYNLRVLALERAFFGSNARSALRIGEARGVVLMLAAEFGLHIYEVSPATVKLRIAGNGQASKEQVLNLVRAHLKDSTFAPNTEDESDAVAIALTAFFDMNIGTKCDRKSLKKAKLPPGSKYQ